MTRFTPIQKLIAAILFYLAVVSASGGIFFWLYSLVQSSAGNLQRIEAEIALLEEERRRARQAEFVFEKKRAEIERLEDFFIPSEKPVEFIEDLEKIARATANVILLDLVSEKPVGGVFAFKVSVEGTEDSVLKYLTLLELMPHEIAVEEFTFQKSRADVVPEDRKKEARLSVVINVKTK